MGTSTTKTETGLNPNTTYTRYIWSYNACGVSEPLITTQTTTANMPIDGLIAYYPFNGNANDESGNNYNGIVTGASLSTDRKGNNNNAYSFSGLSNYISISSVPILQTITICIWIESNLGGGTIIGRDGSYKLCSNSENIIGCLTNLHENNFTHAHNKNQARYHLFMTSSKLN